MSSHVEDTLAQRGSRYGEFTEHSVICQGLKAVMRGHTSNWNTLPDYHKQALETIADKIARILNGDPMYEDNWHDIQGYARLVEKEIKSNSGE